MRPHTHVLSCSDALTLLMITTPAPTVAEIEQAYAARLKDWRLRHRFTVIPEDRRRCENAFRLLPEARQVALSNVKTKGSRRTAAAQVATSGGRRKSTGQSRRTSWTKGQPVWSRVWDLAGAIWSAFLASVRFFCFLFREIPRILWQFESLGIPKPAVIFVIFIGWLCFLHGCALALHGHN